jgi:hypothetical protein
MRSHLLPLRRSLQVGGLGKVTVAEAIVVGVRAALVTLLWRYGEPPPVSGSNRLRCRRTAFVRDEGGGK